MSVQTFLLSLLLLFFCAQIVLPSPKAKIYSKLSYAQFKQYEKATAILPGPQHRQARFALLSSLIKENSDGGDKVDDDGDDGGKSKTKKKKKNKEEEESSSSSKNSDDFDDGTVGKKLQNIDKLGRGYDVLYGYPLAPVDPGYRSAVLYFSYSDRKQSPDGKWIIPNEVDVTSSTACKYDASSYEYTGTTSFQDSLKVAVSVTAGYKGLVGSASFTASTEFNNVYQETNTKHKSFIRSEASCYAYTAQLNNYVQWKFDKNFLSAVATLPVSKPKEKTIHPAYSQFIESFGTHIIMKVNMGAKAMLTFTFESEKLQKMKDQQLNVAAEASASFAGFFAKASTSVTTGKKESSTFSNAKKDTQQQFLGPPIPDLAQNPDLTVWSDKIKKDPACVHMKIQPIQSLMISKHFPQDKDIDSKREKLIEAMDSYCKGTQFKCTVPKDPAPPKPQAGEACEPGTLAIGFDSDTSNPICGVPATCRMCSGSCSGDVYRESVGSRMRNGRWGPIRSYEQCQDSKYKDSKDVVHLCCASPGIINRNAAASICPPGQYAYNFEGRKVLCRPFEKACQMCTSCPPSSPEVGRIVHRDHYGPWHGLQYKCTGSYPKMIGRNDDPEAAYCCKNPSGKFDVNASMRGQKCPPGQVVYGFNKDGSMICDFIEPPCRLCKSCGNGFNKETGRQLHIDDWGQWSTYGAQCRDPLEPNKWLKQEKNILCCRG